MRGSSGPERGALLAGLLLAMLVAMAARAGTADTNVTATVGITRDDNVFRRGDDTGDTWRVAALGARLDLPRGAQQFTVEGGLSHFFHERFSALERTEYQGQLGWSWQAGSRLRGRLLYGTESMFTSLANLQDGVQSSVPNRLDLQRAAAEAGYNAARWQLRGAVDWLEHNNNATEFEASDMRRNGVEAGLAYTSGSGNRIGLTARREHADLPHPQVIAGGSVDNSYRQRRIGSFIDWAVTAKSRLQLRVGRLERSYRQFPERNRKLWTWDLGAEWQPTGRFTLNVGARHDLSPWEQVNVGLVTVTGIALQPALQLGAKTRLALNLAHDWRVHRGNLALGGDATLRERLGVLEMNLSWQVTRVVDVGLAVRREMRRTAQAQADYEAGIAGMKIRAVF